ncbi:hypothetical protein E2320_006953 [Naja naja]|nr:hypothetical protein E2320_006953 [Naja naja]
MLQLVRRIGGSIFHSHPQFKGAETECRAAKHDCDLPELCTGQSAECPTDSLQRNGHPCQNNQGYCYNGKCPTLTNQCIALLGPHFTVSPKGCFDLNMRGDDGSFCRMEDGTKIPCAANDVYESRLDVKCGRLYCTEKNTMSCRIPPNPDGIMAEPRTKCGDGMVCSKGQCVDVQTAY